MLMFSVRLRFVSVFFIGLTSFDDFCMKMDCNEHGIPPDSDPASNTDPGFSRHDESSVHDELRTPMDLPILPYELHCINCGTEITHRRRHILTLVEVQRVILQWVAPLVIGEQSYICHPCWTVALIETRNMQNSEASTSSHHRNLCVRCRYSINRQRSHTLSNNTDREARIQNMIIQWIQPQELRLSDRICHRCWQEADRHAQRNIVQHSGNSNDNSDGDQNQGVGNLGGQIPAGSTFLPNLRRAPDTQAHCFLPNCNSEERLRIPLWLRIQVFSEYNYYIPQQCRICNFHLRNDHFDTLRNETDSIHHFTPNHIEDFASFVKERKLVLDFININQMSDDSVYYWTGLTKQQFLELKSDVRQLDLMKNGTLALAAFLMKIRTGDSNERISSLLNVPTTSLSRYIKKVREVMFEDFVPRNLGISHISREEIATRNLIIPNGLFGGNNRNPIIIMDGTYLYIQKSSNYMYQKDTYSLHKYRNLMKPFLMVCSDGYIVEVLGPFPATTSDANIIINEFSNSDSALRSYFQPGDVFLLDRGFRDSIPLLRQCGYSVHFPESRQPGETQLSTAAANKTRTLTMCRWVVEAVNGIFKMSYKIFRSEYFNTASTHAMTYFKIAAALINKFHQRIRDRPDAEQIITRVNETFHLNNTLGDYVIDRNLNRRRAQFVSMNATLENINFPRLTSDELIILACGTYQIKQARSYYGEHIRNDGSFTIEVCTDRASNLLLGFTLADNCSLLRGKVQSRHISQKTYFVYILYEHNVGIGGIKQYFCNCIVGRRTVGCCAHTMSIIWYLSWAKYENVHPPAQFLDNVLITYEND